MYQKECQPHVPYRCMVGDLSGRLGNINLGLGRYVFSDRNLPLCELNDALCHLLNNFLKNC